MKLRFCNHATVVAPSWGATVLAVVILGSAMAAPPVTACETAPCFLSIRANSEFIVTGHLTVDCVQVEDGGTIIIGSQSTLTLTGPEPSCVDGDIKLTGESPMIEFKDADHRIGGVGTIRGETPSSILRIDGVRLESDIVIRGKLLIIGTGDFHNNGRVIAGLPDPGTLAIDISGRISDTPNVGKVTAANFRWGVTSVIAQLQFNRSVAGAEGALHGHFYVEEGTLRIGKDFLPDDVDVETGGDLLHVSGSIVVGVNDSIAFNVNADEPS